MKEPSFLGASVTIPHKEAVLPFLDFVSPAAKKIGAVNTVLKVNGKLYGENTDWLGICGTVRLSFILFPFSFLPLLNKNKNEKVEKKIERKPKMGLVVGAGGTSRAACFALRELGLKEFFIYNRTKEKAETLAKEFGGKVCQNLNELPGELDLLIGTIPASAQDPQAFPSSLFASKPLVVELAYRPRETPLLRLAKESSCDYVEGS